MIKKYILRLLRKCIKLLDKKRDRTVYNVDFIKYPKELETMQSKFRYCLGLVEDCTDDHLFLDYGESHMIISFDEKFSKPNNYKF